MGETGPSSARRAETTGASLRGKARVRSDAGEKTDAIVRAGRSEELRIADAGAHRMLLDCTRYLCSAAGVRGSGASLD